MVTGVVVIEKQSGIDYSAGDSDFQTVRSKRDKKARDAKKKADDLKAKRKAGKTDRFPSAKEAIIHKNTVGAGAVAKQQKPRDAKPVAPTATTAAPVATATQVRSTMI
jgi:hypothetical protein